MKPTTAPGAGEPPADAIRETPPRHAGSARRTSSIDILRPWGRDGNLMLVGRARDVLTGTDVASIAAEAEVIATVDRDRRLLELRIKPACSTTEPLLGAVVGSGFRSLVDSTVPAERTAQSPLYLLLDDLPVAALISGYADLYFRPDEPGERTEGHPKADICSGWRSDGTMMVAIRDRGRIPIPVGPPAPPLERGGDDLSWHRLDPLPIGGMRRRRRIDVSRDDPLRVDAMFRDTHVGPDGIETVLHEYAVTATVGPANLTIVSIEATPHVLPWYECPWAAASASQLEGTEVGGLRLFVRGALKGVATCTHLNDMLRSMADIVPLAHLLGQGRS